MAQGRQSNAEDAVQIAKAEKAFEDHQQDIVSIMSTQRGRRWIHNLIHTTCHIDQPSHVPNAPDTSAFNEGARSIGIAVKLEARTSPNYLKMMEENYD